ncbi:MAG: hypothetical protein GQ559_04925, partial [Desulfobulbaceae bacterium]|nr:hypothetical protein [Desulfobulbaceae bacterium]
MHNLNSYLFTFYQATEGVLFTQLIAQPVAPDLNKKNYFVAASLSFKFFRAVLILSILLGLLVGGAWLGLKQGIDLARLDLPVVKIENLSIRLEQKLVLTAKRVVLKEIWNGPIKTADIERLVYWTKKALPLVQSIHIDEVVSGNMHTSIAFADNTLRLEGTHFSVAASVVYREGTFFCRIHDLLVKSYDA